MFRSAIISFRSALPGDRRRATKWSRRQSAAAGSQRGIHLQRTVPVRRLGTPSGRLSKLVHRRRRFGLNPGPEKTARQGEIAMLDSQSRSVSARKLVWTRDDGRPASTASLLRVVRSSPTRPPSAVAGTSGRRCVSVLARPNFALAPGLMCVPDTRKNANVPDRMGPGACCRAD